MKTIEIGEMKVRLAENAGDLNITRLTQLKNMIAENSAGMDFPDWQEWFASRKTLYNQGDNYALLTSEINMAQRISTMSESIFHDSAQIIFSLITLEENEIPHEWDKSTCAEKLARMAEQGLTQGEVWDYAEGFILASPQLSNSFFLMSLVAHKKRLTSQQPLETSITDTPEQNQ